MKADPAPRANAFGPARAQRAGPLASIPAHSRSNKSPGTITVDEKAQGG
ncbi:MAG: hypothetical protein H6597_08250 [Flavobacteriales bacterium]|nr:hypothetical protein [Flavobacteriales bacterium]MCB9194506.1 hypothetical protein [Flavobacteriales bacterium]